MSCHQVLLVLESTGYVSGGSNLVHGSKLVFWVLIMNFLTCSLSCSGESIITVANYNALAWSSNHSETYWCTDIKLSSTPRFYIKDNGYSLIWFQSTKHRSALGLLRFLTRGLQVSSNTIQARLEEYRLIGAVLRVCVQCKCLNQEGILNLSNETFQNQAPVKFI